MRIPVRANRRSLPGQKDLNPPIAIPWILRRHGAHEDQNGRVVTRQPRAMPLGRPGELQQRRGTPARQAACLSIRDRADMPTSSLARSLS